MKKEKKERPPIDFEIFAPKHKDGRIDPETLSIFSKENNPLQISRRWRNRPKGSNVLPKAHESPSHEKWRKRYEKSPSPIREKPQKDDPQELKPTYNKFGEDITDYEVWQFKKCENMTMPEYRKRLDEIDEIYGKTDSDFSSDYLEELKDVVEGKGLPPKNKKPIQETDPYLEKTLRYHNARLAEQPGLVPKDTIPPWLKEYFFQDKRKPNLLTDYDVIGFDMDHCLAKFDVLEFTKLVVKAYLTELTQKFKYPAVILQFNYNYNIGVFHNNCVWDIETGCVLKLAEGKLIERATLGFQALKQHEIITMYGNPPIYQNLMFPRTNKRFHHPGAQWTLMGYFECAMIPVICQLVHHIRVGNISKKFMQAAYDLDELTFRMYANYDDKQIFPINRYGLYYPIIARDPTTFIIEQSDLKKTLQRLKSKGKYLFLATNKHFEYVELVMNASFGKDWQNLFDLILLDCKKPLFYKTMQPFVVYDNSQKLHKGQKLVSTNDIKLYTSKTNILMEGNASILTHFFQEKFQKVDISVAFFGQSFLTNILPTYEFNKRLKQSKNAAKWDAFAVVEELSYVDAAYQNGVNPHLVQHSMRYWGIQYFLHERKEPVIGQHGLYEIRHLRNYFINEIQKKSRYVVPFVKNIDLLMQEEKSKQKSQHQDKSKSSKLQKARFAKSNESRKINRKTGLKQIWQTITKSLPNLKKRAPKIRLNEGLSPYVELKKLYDQTKITNSGKYFLEERESDKSIYLHPARADHQYSFVWLHGLGDSAQGFRDAFISDQLFKLPDSCKIILPTAPVRKVSVNDENEMHSWYDMFDSTRPYTNKCETNTQAFFNEHYDQVQIKDSVKIVSDLIRTEIKKLGSASKVFLGGFSQGSVIALATYLNFSEGQLGGVVGCSGAQIADLDWNKIDVSQKKKTPVYLLHGTEDPMISLKDSKQIYQSGLSKHGVDHFQFMEFKGLDHRLSKEVIHEVSLYLTDLIQ